MKRPTIVDIRRANYVLERGLSTTANINTNTTTTAAVAAANTVATTSISPLPPLSFSPSFPSLSFPSVFSSFDFELCAMFGLLMLSIFFFLQYCNWFILILLFLFLAPSFFSNIPILLLPFAATTN